MKYIWIILIVFAAPAYAKPLTPEIVEKEMQLHSPRSARVMYFKCDNMTGYDYIAQGSNAWLNIGIKLLPFTSGCERALLMDAFARAIQAAPENMLRHVDSQPELAANKICLPQFTDEKAARQIAYADELVKKLERIEDEQLKAKAQACIERAKALRAKLQPDKEM
jgi:hypothetical protein